MKDTIGIIAVLLAFVAYVPYFRDIFQKKALPHPYSWIVWGVTSFVIFALQWAHGGGAGSYTTLTVGIISLLVAILGFWRGARQAITTQDTVLFIIALIATFLWLFIHQPILSTILLTGADMIGLIPSLRKVWHKPYEETLSMWAINAGRHALSIFALGQYNVITLLNPVAWVIGNSVFSIVLMVRRQAMRKK